MAPKRVPLIFTRIYGDVRVSMTSPKSSSLMMLCPKIKDLKYLNHLSLSLYLFTSNSSKALKFLSLQMI